MSLRLRPVTQADLPAVTDLAARWDTHWFGAPERSADEIAEMIGSVPSIETNGVLAVDDANVLGVGLRWRTDTSLFADPGIDPRPAYDLLVPWFAAGTPAHVEVLSRDDRLRDYLEAAGWKHRKSSFEMMRTVDDTLRLDRPQWPDGVTARPLGAGEDEAVHRLIYVDAGWADVPGHPHREFAEWRPIFLGERVRRDQQVLAWRGDRLVGAAVTRLWDDGTGWISQLATARTERRKGLGRALLLQSLAGLVAAGATMLGLAVVAQNRGALGLYSSVGLEIDREWMEYSPDAQ